MIKSSNYNIIINGYSPDDIFLFNSISRGMKKVNKRVEKSVMEGNFEQLSSNEVVELKKSKIYK